MTDFSTAVEYDRAHKIKIVNPVDGSDTGITISVVSQDSKRVTDALRGLQADVWSKMAEGVTVSPVEAAHERENVILYSCIVHWDWGDGSFAHISGDGEPSLEDRKFLIYHNNAKWIKDQIAEVICNLQNFIQPSQKNAPSGSKKT